jgi:hypothetical protein
MACVAILNEIFPQSLRNPAEKLFTVILIFVGIADGVLHLSEKLH